MLGSVEKNSKLEKVTNTLVSKYKNTLSGPKEKFFGVNTKNENRIEFRYLGGSKYHKKYDKIQTQIGKYSAYLKIALDPNERNREYLMKLERLFNKYAPNSGNKNKNNIPGVILNNSFWYVYRDFEQIITVKYMTLYGRKAQNRLKIWFNENRKNKSSITDGTLYQGVIPYKSYYENKLAETGVKYTIIEDEKLPTTLRDIEDFGEKIILFLFVGK